MFKVGDKVERTGLNFYKVKTGRQYTVRYVNATADEMELEEVVGSYSISEFKKVGPPTFWMVYNPRHSAPRVQHPTHEAAVAEAQRLARLQPDDTFYVLAVSAIVKAEVSISTTEVK